MSTIVSFMTISLIPVRDEVMICDLSYVTISGIRLTSKLAGGEHTIASAELFKSRNSKIHSLDVRKKNNRTNYRIV